MAFLDLATKARKDPLGPVFLSALKNNLALLRSLMQVEHMTSGEHNVLRVPRAVVSVDWGGASYSISPSSADVTAVSNPATGTVRLTLAANRFTSNIRCQLNYKGTNVDTKPFILGCKITSATSVDIFIKKLTSALGAGNAWAAADGSIDVALHSDPLSKGAWSTTPALPLRGDTLTRTDWNNVVQAQGDMNAALKAGHASGLHNVREVAKGYAHVLVAAGAASFSGTTGSHSSNVTSVSRTSTGIVAVTHGSYTTPTQNFVCPDYARTSGSDPALFVAQAAQTSATVTTVYTYKYDTGGRTWALADCDFFLASHGG